ncbi:DUF3137 domain-containing protein [Microbacterium sp. SS28]|uniref:DUF3137 domain-containing protein n=1 Tax=Microbacterium sp. SS28 TaxID=2919948 RepID=UPI001FAA5B70|nr:DUF3137 domain-containing protein [Microbacterium sp. SS28]
MSDPRSAGALPFDARPLVDAVDRPAAREFARRLRAQGRVTGWGSATTIVTIVVVAVMVLAFGGTFVSIFVSILTTVFASGGQGAWIGTLVLIVPLVLFGVVAAAIVVGVIRGTAGQSERWWRLDRFARANAMSYLPHVGQPALPGMIFGIGSSRAASDVVRGDRPRFVEFANYRYTTGSGKNRTTHAWGYVAVKLDVPLPNIVLDARGNNAIFGTNLPATFDADQRLHLEGDFDEHFALYCPEGYERDALYLFTPDIMARFIDHAAALDVEIVDDWLFLYAKRDFSTLDPATWAWLFSVVAALLDKLAQWGRWRDERLAEAAADPVAGTAMAAAGGAVRDAASGALVGGAAVPFAAPAGLLRPPPGVAPQGRRLTRRVSWVSIALMVAIIVWWIVSQTGMLGLFFR